jgi:hypothetical protein
MPTLPKMPKMPIQTVPTVARLPEPQGRMHLEPMNIPTSWEFGSGTEVTDLKNGAPEKTKETEKTQF